MSAEPPPSTAAGSSSAGARYADLAYPGKTYPFAHPDRLAALARLHGLTPPPIETARILELGCGDAVNLLSIAYQLPEARCVGIDLCDEWLVVARQRAADAGLTNLELITADLATVDFAALGSFDYVIAHGLFSWIPAPVRDRLMALVDACLSPDGVGMISYNTYPGWHFRQIGRAIMQWHGDQFDDPRESVQAGRQMLEFMSETLETNPAVYPAVLRDLVEFLEPCSDAYLYHDILAPVSDPIYFKDFAALLERSGLQYVAESNYGDVIPAAFPERFQELLHNTPDRIRREQLIDLMRNTMFRRSLICRADRAVWPARAETIGALHLRILGEHVGQEEAGGDDVSDDAGEVVGQVYRTRDERDVTVYDPLVHVSLGLLGEALPGSLAVDTLYEQAVAVLASVELETDTSVEHFRELMLQLYAGELLDLLVRDRPVAREPGARPRLNALARSELDAGQTTITNVLHEQVQPGPFELVILRACDGTRDRRGLIDAVTQTAVDGGLVVNVQGRPTRDPQLIAEAVSIALPDVVERVVQLGLLESPARA